MLLSQRRSTYFLTISCALGAALGCDKAPQKADSARTLSPTLPARSLVPRRMASSMPVASELSALVDPMTKLNADMVAVIDQLEALHGKPIETLSATEARTQPTPSDAVQALLKKRGKSSEPEPVGKVENRTIPGPGGALPLSVYTPRTGKAPYPVIVYYHGGGFVIGSNATYDASARGLANGASALLVAVEYRKAPENKFPAAHDDALAAYQWVLANAGTLGGDESRVAVVGESAGGNLAASVSIAARDRGLRLPLYQVLIYPIAGCDVTTPSYQEDANAKPLNISMMNWFFDKYLRGPSDARDPRVDVVHANLAGLPSTTIINAEIDPLRSDGELLADALRAAKVTVVRKTFSGVTHEFFGMGAAVDAAKDAMEVATSALKTALE